MPLYFLLPACLARSLLVKRDICSSLQSLTQQTRNLTKPSISPSQRVPCQLRLRFFFSLLRVLLPRLPPNFQLFKYILLLLSAAVKLDTYAKLTSWLIILGGVGFYFSSPVESRNVIDFIGKLYIYACSQASDNSPFKLQIEIPCSDILSPRSIDIETRPSISKFRSHKIFRSAKYMQCRNAN